MSEGSEGSDKALGWFIIICILLILFYIFWNYYEFRVKDAVRWVRYLEMWLPSLWTTQDYTVDVNGVPMNYHGIYDQVANIAQQNLTDHNMYIISSVAMAPFRLVFALVLAVFGFWSLFWGPGTQYRRKMGIDGLIKAQAPNFPVIFPFVKFNPSDQPVRPPGSPVPAELPLFSEALGPEEWIAFNSVPIPDGKLDRDVATNVFVKQLGPPWRGVMKLPPHRQVLLAAFCLKAARKRADADDMLGKLAQCWDFKNGLKLDAALVRKARKILRNKDISGKTLSKCNQHAFQNTVMLRALQTAREEGGVLSPSQFLWLRGYDRSLWYPLNNLGRQACHMEALGALSHYRAEKRTSRPIPRPKVSDAVQSISNYMASSIARPVPALDYSTAKKKRSVKKIKGSV